MKFRHVMQAALNPVDLDERQINAVAARIELDLRLGAIFTRFQTLILQPLVPDLLQKVISYGMSGIWGKGSRRTCSRCPAIYHPLD